MPFKPRIVQPEEEGAPLHAMQDGRDLNAGLPPELADLATKLQADAAWLASAYPARDGVELKPMAAPAAERAFRWASFTHWQILAAAVCIVVGGAAWMVSIRRDELQPEAAVLSIHAPTAMEANFFDAQSSAAFMKDAAEPTSLLRQATGPELEGLLDLMEDDSLTGSVVSL